MTGYGGRAAAAHAAGGRYLRLQARPFCRRAVAPGQPPTRRASEAGYWPRELRREQTPADARAAPSASAPNDIDMGIPSSPKRPRDPAQDIKVEVSPRAMPFAPAMLESQLVALLRLALSTVACGVESKVVCTLYMN
eukprot:scaffold33572_cov122-Isochrysis_galbana.AAC.2